jgi:hypothetical protein
MSTAMRRNISIFLTTAILMLLGVLIAPAQNESAAKAQIDALVNASAAAKLERIEVFRLPKDYESYVAVQPEDIESRWLYKFTIRQFRSPRNELTLAALRSATVQRSARNWEVRWGIVFYSRPKETRIAALYFDESGRYGAVDKIPVSFGPDFFPRLKNALHLTIE